MSEVAPGGTVGVLGGGQLARMMGLEARRLGLRVAVLDPDPRCSAAQVCDEWIEGALDDAEAGARLAARADVVTLDTEHVPARVIERVEEVVRVVPSSREMATIQDRLEQRRFLARMGAPQPRHHDASDGALLARAVSECGTPAVLKSRFSGYDGKGQRRIEHADGALDAWRSIGEVPALVESFVEFRAEISVVLARAASDDVAFYPVVENVHRRHILHTSRAPARIPPAVAEAARDLGARLARELDHVGVMAVELFVTDDDRLLVNEIAPRVHNSGHYTFGACRTSQFEQHLRAVCGWPLGDCSAMSGAVMLNLLGDLWERGQPDWSPVLRRPEARLHLYGKERASAGRKMGHVVLLDDDTDRALETAEALMGELTAR